MVVDQPLRNEVWRKWLTLPIEWFATNHHLANTLDRVCKYCRCCNFDLALLPRHTGTSVTLWLCSTSLIWDHQSHQGGSLITIISNLSLLTITSSHDCGLCRHKHNHQWHWEIAHYSKCVTRNEVNCSVGNKSQPQMSVVIFVSAAIIHWNCHPHT